MENFINFKTKIILWLATPNIRNELLTLLDMDEVNQIRQNKILLTLWLLENLLRLIRKAIS